MNWKEAMLAMVEGKKVRELRWFDGGYISAEGQDKEGDQIGEWDKFVIGEWEIYHDSEQEPDYGEIISNILADAHDQIMALSIFSKE